MAKLEPILYFIDNLLSVRGFPDYSHALNGLQVEAPEEVHRIAVAVDASEATIQAAVDLGTQLLVVHHGLFWDGLGPLRGPRFRKVKALIEGRMGLYAAHLPLDAHPEIGNCALLTREMGLEPSGPFGSFDGQPVGWWAQGPVDREELKVRMAAAVGGGVRLVPGGPETVEKVGVVTGGGASFLVEAATMAVDTLVTGEAAHHHFHEAMELGINLLLGGHYATETFGVKALGGRLSEEFGVTWEFLDLPTGF